jgi:hypothetical protein
MLFSAAWVSERSVDAGKTHEKRPENPRELLGGGTLSILADCFADNTVSSTFHSEVLKPPPFQPLQPTDVAVACTIDLPLLGETAISFSAFNAGLQLICYSK